MAATDGGQGRGGRQRGTIAIVVVCVLLGGLAGFAFYSVQSPVYESETSVLVLPTAGGLDSSVGGTRTGEVQIQTEAEVAGSAQVAAAASDSLDGAASPQELMADGTVTTSPNSEVLVIGFSAGTQELARDGSQALAQAYLDRRSADAKQARDDAVGVLESKLTEAQANLTEATVALAAARVAGKVADEAQAEADIALAQSQISDVNSRLVALRVQTTQGGQIISEAPLPQNPQSPVLWIDLAAGLLLGALIGSGIVLARDRMRSTGQPADVPALSPAPAVVRHVPAPVSPAVGVPMASEEEAGDRPRGEDAASGLQVLASLELDDAGTVSAAEAAALGELAVAIAGRGGPDGPVIVVGVDYPALMTGAAFALSDAWASAVGGSALVLTEQSAPGSRGMSVAGRGLTDVLSGEWPVDGTVEVVEAGRQAVLGVGLAKLELPPATQRRRLANVWSDLEEEYGTVLAHVQVPFDGALAQSVLQTAGPVLVVVKVGLSQQQDLAYAVEQLNWLGVADQVAGIVSVSSASHAATATKPSGGTAKGRSARSAKVDVDLSGDTALVEEGSGRADQ